MNEVIKVEEKRISKILSKAGDPKALTFKTIDEKALQKIESFMPEINRAVTSFSKKNSQTTASLMTLTMLEAGPYRTLRQILAQIEKKRSALKENIYKIEKKKIQRRKLLNQLETEQDTFARDEAELKLAKIEADIIDAQPHIEAALKEIGAYQERYKEIVKNHGLPENWDETDFEEAEIEHHIKSIFRNAIRDRMQGSGGNMGTMEYMEQYGIEPVLAYHLVDQFIIQVRQGVAENKPPSIEMRYQFLDRMYNTFKDEYKKALKRIGLDSITHAEWLMKENK